LALEQLDEAFPEEPPAWDSDSSRFSTDPEGATLAEIERHRIIQALEKHGGNAKPPKLHEAKKTSVAKC
jgi:hypothetical protein